MCNALKVPANHLLSASFMSAPAALAMSKLFYPETEKSLTTAKNAREILPKPKQSVIQFCLAIYDIYDGLVVSVV